MPGRLLSFQHAKQPAQTRKASALIKTVDVASNLQLLAYHDPAAFRVIARMTARFAGKIRKAIGS